MMPLQKVMALLNAALEATIYLSPTDLWLTPDELYEVGRRAGFRDGEIGDALSHVATLYFGAEKRVEPKGAAAWAQFILSDKPDYHDYMALDFVITELNAHAKEFGLGSRGMERGVLVERASSVGIARLGCEAAITSMRLTGALNEKNGLISLKTYWHELPSDAKAKMGYHGRNATVREEAHAIVKDIIARRSDGRPKHVESLDAFSDALDLLGHAPFRLWWTQTVVEFRRTEPTGSPVAKLVLAAALVEGALTFLVKYARARNVGPFGSTTFGEEPRKWKLDALVESASKGGRDNEVFDVATKGRIEGLLETRQRIHAGRMLSDHPRGVPDLRPEEAREAQTVAELAVRKILDWIKHHP